MNKQNFDKPQYFINRELSWLEFNQRVLDEAKNKKNPLFERLKFLAISASNLDEFFMVRVASLKDQVDAKYTKADSSGLSPKEQLAKISIRTHKMVISMYNAYNHAIKVWLKKIGTKIIKSDEVTSAQKDYLEKYFMTDVFPVITPMAVDSGRPFPLILNKSLNLAVLMRNKKDKKKMFATVQVPSVLPRLIPVPSEDANTNSYIFLEEVIKLFISRFFAGKTILYTSTYRITRNADLSIEEEEAEDLLVEIEKSLRQRQWGASIRLEVEFGMKEELLIHLRDSLEVHYKEIYHINGPIDLTFLFKVYSFNGYDDYKYSSFKQKISAELDDYDKSIFAQIRSHDIFLHHPYDSFKPVIRLINDAADDDNVLAIKQTLYRVSGNSPIIPALARAAENGKQVTVLVEVKARFDEENNIQWAKKLEQAGCHVIYGIVGLKTHSKITLIIRRENDGIKRYLHLGTGNYNDITASIYTDYGLMTCNEDFGTDAAEFFNMLSGGCEVPYWSKFSVAPMNLRQTFTGLIQCETENAIAGRPAKIIAKMNSLVDTEIIKLLYAASCAGVTIELIVRGVCCLRPQIKGISENITVRSIIGRFLEHSRVFYFLNNGNNDIYFSSADWMPRNLDRRIELLFPIEDESIKLNIQNLFELYMNDTEKSHIMLEDGTYEDIDKRGKKRLNYQNLMSREE